MSLFKSICAGALLYLVFLLATLPAKQVLPHVVNEMEGVAVEGISGTLWQGRINTLQLDHITLSNARWSINWGQLFRAKLSLNVHAGNRRDKQQISIKGNVALGFSGVSANELTVYAPASLIASQMALPLPVIAQGRMKLTVAYYDQGAPYCEQLQGKADWLNAKIQGMNGPIDLKNLSADLACEKGAIAAIVNQQNVLGLKGKAMLAANNKISVEASAKPTASLPREVTQAFEFVGAKAPDGSYSFKF